MPRFKYVCAECGNASLSYDANAFWDEDLQKFVLDGLVGEDPYCPDCGDRVNEEQVQINDNGKFDE